MFVMNLYEILRYLTEDTTKLHPLLWKWFPALYVCQTLCYFIDYMH